MMELQVQNGVLLGYDDKEFWNWFAGFWEGEGSLSFNQEYHRQDGRTYKKIRLTVAQANRKPLDYILGKLGVGYLYFRQPKRQNLAWHDRGTWLWSVDRRLEVIEVCHKMLPYLRFRDIDVSQKLKAIEEYERLAGWHKWYPNEVETLKQTYALMPKEELVRVLGRKWSSIKAKAKTLKLRRNR